ncbi:type 2 lanthipeptide synthetase LanM [Pseudomonas thivervalensis]|uniref:type 2 lanthipeptide synthetase LanM n=1 Tax=Pseudomonas thivervalensis TaxID=86265 RepID=UPI00069D0873|nr:type 2 lanthipeptide synthetase LanM [Pseudomonas thivervalensis]OAB53295.1 lantibiotic-modifying protein [Pseudomonas thivervalensis]SDG63045.1 type 2 lantibiotic biosynthesis protein LanM [Pseudomonas thivervalensis]
MLVNALKMNQRGQYRFSSDDDIALFENNLTRLHNDDQALLNHFGLDRAQLAAYAREPVNDRHLPADGQTALMALQEKLARLDSLHVDPLASTGNDNFYWFGYRLFLYLIDTFKADGRYDKASMHINEPGLFAGLERYVLARVGRTSEQSLVHYLNTRIADGDDIDLGEFSEQLRTLPLFDFFEAYPVLATLLFELLEDTVNYLYAIILDFAEDIEALETAFSIPSRKIDAIEFGLGDPHGRGETVCQVKFRTTSLVYKPRASREALFFNHLLGQLHEWTGADCFAIQAPGILSRERHSWVEKIDNTPCDSAADVALFYKKMGAQIAVIHALNGIDFHYENIIACGSSPVMIDLECLFTASTSDLLLDLPVDCALSNAFKWVQQSVCSSGFVPFSQQANNDQSGLTRQELFISTRHALVVEEGFYHLRKTKFEHAPEQKHLPLLHGEHKGPEAYKAELFHGFEYAYDTLMTHRQTMMQMLEQSAGELSTRLLFKNSQRYADFIGLSRHPRFMKNMLDRELLLATLWQDLQAPYREKGIPRYEIADLQRASIPCFTLSLSANQLMSAQGETIEMTQIQPPIKSCLKKIANLSKADRALQLTLLEMCLYPEPNGQPLSRATPETAAPANRLDGILSISSRLEALALTGTATDVSWLAFHTHPTTHRKYPSPMDHGLYSGIAGIGLFYLSLFKVSGKPHVLSLVDQVLDSLEQHFGFFRADLTVSAYHGLGAYLYLLINRRQITGDPKHDKKIASLLSQLIEVPPENYDFDFLGGCCGAVTLLANIHALTGQADVLPAIRRMVDYIKDQVLVEDSQLLRRDDRSVILTGLSHGLSGVIHALCKAYDVTRDGALVPLATQILKGENRLSREGFWLDLRDLGPVDHATKWCHGDGGILIARQQLMKSMGDALDETTRQTVLDDIQRCEHNLWRHGLGDGYNLCHGDFGNLICLYDWYRHSNNPEGIDRVKQALGEVARKFFDGPFLDSDRVPDVSLLTGITGAGYALLYEIDPTIPNILTLDFAVPA